MSTPDKDSLHMLAIFHYVMAGFIALASCIPLIHLTVGLTMTVGGITAGEPEVGIVGVFFAVIASVIILAGFGIAVLVFFAGKNLDNQTKYQLCVAGAGLLCVFVPMGTVLGVFTLVSLQSDSVKALFNNKRCDMLANPDSV